MQRRNGSRSLSRWPEQGLIPRRPGNRCESAKCCRSEYKSGCLIAAAPGIAATQAGSICTLPHIRVGYNAVASQSNKPLFLVLLPSSHSSDTYSGQPETKPSAWRERPITSKLVCVAGKYGIRRALFLCAMQRGLGCDSAKSWNDQHVRCRFHDLYEFQYVPTNHHQRRCLFYYGTHNASSVNHRRNKHPLSSANGTRSSRRHGQCEWGSLYISWRVSNHVGLGSYWKQSTWDDPAGLLFQRWRDVDYCNHERDPQRRRCLHLSARRGAYHGSEFQCSLDKWRLRFRCILGSRRRNDTGAQRRTIAYADVLRKYP